MIIVWALSWWYGAGYRAQLERIVERLKSSYDYFSIGLLASTLFAPYKQISAGKVNGPIGLQLRAFTDRTVSRVIGAVVRSILIIAGCLWLVLLASIGLIVCALWAVIPLMPFIGFILMIWGWVPTWR